VGEYRFGGEKLTRPPDPSQLTAAQWAHYVYDRRNVSGLQTEWWYHRGGCRQWFLAERHTVTNAVQKTWLP
jgi:sarcosine oxidase subunit delta